MDALPSQPGFALFNYFTFYNGSAGATRTFPIAGQIAASVEATSYVETPGGFWVTPLALLGGHYAVTVTGTQLPILRDEGGRLARRLVAQYATESFVFDSNGKLRYRGE